MLGLRALATLQVLQYPKTQNAVVTITTVYYGADPQTSSPASSPRRWRMPIAQANGIDYMTLDQPVGVSTITVEPAAELRRQQGADRDQHQDQLGA